MAGEVKPVEMCVFKLQFESMLRIERGNIRLQAAVESDRNEKVKTGLNLQNTLIDGFVKIGSKNNGTESLESNVAAING